jgi:riboflavin kinase/FMN adenylyltransferase
MRVFRQLNNLPHFNNSVITIGTFDGVHLGHQKLVKRINELARQCGGESIIVTFHPHPRIVINPQDKSLRLLSTVDEKIKLLENYGVDNLVIVPFSRDFSEQPAETYVTDFLVQKFQPKYIVIGYDHKFGKDRSGGLPLLQELKEKFGYELEEIPAQEIDDLTVSSTKIRNALLNAEVRLANDLLGYNYTLSGTVVKGLQNGRKLGYPTANILVGDEYKLIPRTGIYAVRVHYNGQVYGGMLSIGYNPTFDGKEMTIEVNILDFDKEVYGEQITLEFIEYVRQEKKFDNLEDLVKAIDNDKVEITRILAQ